MIGSIFSGMPVSFEAVPEMGGPIRRQHWKWAVPALAVAAVLAWVAYPLVVSRSFDWRLAWSTLERLQGRWLAISLIPIAGCYWVRALRWAVFLRPLKERPSIPNLCSATIVGFTAITLFGRAGELVRPYLIAVKEHVPVPSQLAALVLERIFDTLMALLIFGFGLMHLAAAGTHLGPRLGWVVQTGGRSVAAGCVILFILLVSIRHLARPVQRCLVAAFRFLPEKHFRKIEHLIVSLVQGLESTRSDGSLLLVFLYSLLEWALIIVLYWCVTQSFSGIIPLTFMDVIVFVGFVSFGAVVQLPGIGGGLQVVAVVVLTEVFHVKLEIASSFAILLWIITFVVVVPFGLILGLREGLNWSSLRKIGREVV